MKLIQPLATYFPVTQKFGENPGSYSTKCLPDGSHNGVDFGCPAGTPVLATADGVITRADLDNTGYGLHIRVSHLVNGQRFFTLYGHLSVIHVKAGMAVKAGEVLGLSGSTGNSTGPHLHFELRLNEDRCCSAADPETYFEVENREEVILSPGIYTALGDPILNVRDAPGGQDIGDIPMGEQVEVLKGTPVERNGYLWYPIRWKGWVAGEFLERGNYEKKLS